MRYSDDLIEEIRVRNDIVDVVGGYVKLKRKGSSHFGLCPFHNEKSPSFSVSEGKQMYYCFGCGVGGNVFTFVMEYENYTFPEAVKLLADRVGIAIPEQDYSKEAREQADLKSMLLQIQKDAAKFYYYQLRTQGGEAASRYLLQRGLTKETMKRFGLGYSGKFGGGLYKHLKDKHYSDDLLRQSGLFQADEKKGMYDKFWNRVIFPIMDVNNRVIGFGGRVMGDGKPKYLNSPETRIFDKSRNLYGLNMARTARKKNLIVCEGYLDVIAMHQAGFTNAVASLGTALTSQQAGLMKRYTQEVLIVYDSDPAGVKAALRAIPLLKQAGLNAKVVDLTPHKDPDEFIEKEGQEAFENRLNQAANSFLYQVKSREGDYNLGDPQGKTDFFHEIAGQLLEFDDEIERNNYIEALARIYGVEYDMLRSLVNKLGLKQGGGVKTARPRALSHQTKEKEDGYQLSQKLMLTWMVTYPGIFEVIETYLSVDDFVNPLYHTVAELLFEQYRRQDVNPARLLNHFTDSEEQRKVGSLFNTQLPLDTDAERSQALMDVICRMKESSINFRSEHMDLNDMREVMDIMEEKKQLEELQGRKMQLHISFD